MTKIRGGATIIRHSIENVLKYTELQLFVDMPCVDSLSGIKIMSRIIDESDSVEISLLQSQILSSLDATKILRACALTKLVIFENNLLVHTIFRDLTTYTSYNSNSYSRSMTDESKLSDKDYQFRLELSNSKNIEFPIGTKIRLLARE